MVGVTQPDREVASARVRTRERPVLVVTPYSLESNPYVPQLMDALGDRGLEVEVAGGRSPLLLWRALRRHGVPGVLHLQWHHPYLTADRLPAAVLRALLFFVQVLTLRAIGTRFVWTIHNIAEHERRHLRWELFACRILARLVHVPVVHCTEAAREVSAAYGIAVDRIRVVPHGTFDVTGEPDRAAARRSLGLTDDDVFLLTFGRVRPYKGIDRLLEALDGADASRLKLLVAGFPDDPGYAESLQRKGSGNPRVSFRFEAVADDELSRLLSACDAVVLPYRQSLTSGAAVLASAHGRPVIAPRLGCLRELPSDGAVLYDPEADDGLERALSEAVEARLDAMGRVARSYVEQHPWSLVAERTMDVYREVCAGRSGPRVGL